ncbi:MAG TPA: ABC transporter substrate-binding protein [Firmicutes bacterium]|jgi:NitT/TauT family transport system substrate-binding protein|nr:ABC transporter substrate-binding protein [Bacillota bacterium]
MVSRNSRKGKIFMGLTLAVALVVALSGGVIAKQNLVTVNVAYQPNMNGASVLAIGMEKKFFEEYGIKVNSISFLSGPPELQAMAAGDVDLGYIGPGATFLAAQGLAKILTIDNISFSDSILVAKKSGIKKVKDLKGKVVATPKGTTGEQLLLLTLERNNVNAADVSIVNMDVAGAVAAFVAGKVDAVAIWSPYTVEIEKQLGKENVVSLASYKDFPDKASPASYLVRPDFLQKNPDVVVRFLKGWIKANDYRKRNMTSAIQYTGKLLVQVQADQLAQMASITQFYSSKDLNRMLQDGSVYKMYDNLIKAFVKNGQLQQYVDPKNFVDPAPFNKALK